MKTRHAASNAPYCAFFDVDGTLINTRSVLSFLPYLDRLATAPPTTLKGHWQEIRSRFNSKESREKLNSFYYRIYKGLEVKAVEHLAQTWFKELRQQDYFYNENGLKELRRHQDAGATLVFVTGSFTQVMAPLAEELGAHTVLCSPMEIVDGRFTGSLIGSPCIGQGKADAIRHFAEQEGIRLENCFAYGDDESDAPMLRMVGNPAMVTPQPRYQQELTELLSHYAS